MTTTKRVCAFAITALLGLAACNNQKSATAVDLGPPTQTELQFIEAIEAGDKERISALMQDIRPDIRDVDGRTPLMLAALEGDIATMEALMKRDAHINLKDHSGMTALMWAASDGQTEAVKLLMQHKAETQHIDETGMTAMQWAASNSFEDTAAALKGH